MAFKSATSEPFFYFSIHWQPLLLGVVSAVVLLLFSGATSPLYNIAYSDGLVFRYISLALSDGYTLYVDVFDNKGPLLYLINYLALLIHPTYGLLFLQWLNWSLFFCLCYRLHNQLHSRHFFLWVLPLLFTFIIRFLDNGNLTEEWSLLPLTLPLFFILPLYQGKTTELLPSQSFFYGFCIGLLALLRLNNVIPLVGILLWWLIGLIRQRRYASLGRFCGISFLGFLLPVSLVALWLYHQAGLYGLYEWYYATILVNIDYFFEQVRGASSVPLWKLLPVFFFHATLISLALIKFCNKSQQSSLVISLFLTFVLTYLSMGQHWFPHYQMILLPTFLLSFSLLLQESRHLLFPVLLITSIYMCKYNLSDACWHYQHTADNQAFRNEFAQVIDQIPSTERDQLWNLNATVFVFVDVALQHRLYPLNRVDRPNLVHDCYPQPSFITQHPLWVVVDEDELIESSSETQFLKQHYRQIACTHSSFRHHLSLYRQR